MSVNRQHVEDISEYIRRVLLGGQRRELISERGDVETTANRIKEIDRQLKKIDADNPRICGEQEYFSVTRYLNDYECADAKGIYFDKQIAFYALNFFARLKITQGELAGKPFHLFPWQKFVVWNLFGWRWKSNNARRFSKALIQLARGNGKTPFGAGILFLAGGFLPDCPQRGDNYTTATKKDQAKIAYNDIIAILDDCPELKDQVEQFANYFKVRQNRCTFQAVSSDGKTADGWRILTVLVDEYHAWDNTDKITKFDNRIKTALGKFDNAMSIVITTAGSETSYKWIELDRLARMVVSPHSEISLDSFFTYICELDVEDDLLDYHNYHKSNPMLEYGIVKEQFLRDYIVSASVSAEAKRELERFHANRRVQSDLKPFNAKIWAGGSDRLDVGGYVPTGGLDLGERDDFSALGIVWKLPGDIVKTEEGETRQLYKWNAEVDVWIPRGGKRDLTEEPFATWIKQGWLRVTQSDWTDYNAIYQRIIERQEMHGFQSIAYDPWQANQIAIDLTNEGIELEKFDQSNRNFNEPCREFQQSVFEKRFFHGGNPLLEWCACNYMTTQNAAGHIRPDKATSEEKIDPIVAVIEGLAQSLFAEPVKRSKYESEELFLFDATEDGGYREWSESQLDE